MIILDADYFSISEEDIRDLSAVLTIVDGKIVFGAGEFESIAPPMLPVLPAWSPVKFYGGYQNKGF